MNLVIDLGNTLAKLALFKGGKMKYFIMAEKLPLGELTAICSKHGVKRAILSSVVAVDDEKLHYLEGLPFFLRLGPDTALPIVNDYASPETLGNDRLACAVAAAAKFPGKAVLSIDAGTCIKYDFVNAEGHYLGGAISPGLEMRLKAMHTFTARLPLVEVSKPEQLTGNTTHASLLSGAVGGAVAEVSENIRRYRKEYPGLKVLLTGGDSVYFEEPLKNRIFAVPDLLLRGLNLILEYNAQIE